MKLAQVLPEIRTGDVLLFRGHSLFSYLIKVRTRSVYSHAGIVQRIRTNGHDRVWLIESLEPFGVRLYPLERYIAAGESIDWFQLTDQSINREKIADYAMQAVGDLYAIRGLLAHFTILGHFLSRLKFMAKLSARANRREKYFCSQLVAAALAHAGFHPDEGLVPIETDPGAVARFTCLQRRGALEP
jgi:hypothetical protein